MTPNMDFGYLPTVTVHFQRMRTTPNGSTIREGVYLVEDLVTPQPPLIGDELWVTYYECPATDPGAEYDGPQEKVRALIRVVGRRWMPSAQVSRMQFAEVRRPWLDVLVEMVEGATPWDETNPDGTALL